MAGLPCSAAASKVVNAPVKHAFPIRVVVLDGIDGLVVSVGTTTAAEGHALTAVAPIVGADVVVTGYKYKRYTSCLGQFCGAVEEVAVCAATAVVLYLFVT